LNSEQTIQIFTTQGKEVLTTKADANTAIPTTGLAAGVYHVRIGAAVMKLAVR
jgi:hypothetical protein